MNNFFAQGCCLGLDHAANVFAFPGVVSCAGFLCGTNQAHNRSALQISKYTLTSAENAALAKYASSGSRATDCTGDIVVVSCVWPGHVGIRFAKCTRIVLYSFVSNGHGVLHNAIALTVVIGVMCPTCDQWVYQDVSCILVLIESKNLYVFEKRRLTRKVGGSVIVTFTNVSPIIYIACTFLRIDISSIVVHASLSIGVGSNAAIGVIDVWHIFLCRIFVIITVILIPHFTNVVSTIIMERNINRIVIDFGLYYTFAIVLIQRFIANAVLRQVNCFDCQA